MSSEQAPPPPHGDPTLQQLMNQAREISQLRRDLDALGHEATDGVAGSSPASMSCRARP